MDRAGDRHPLRRVPRDRQVLTLVVLVVVVAIYGGAMLVVGADMTSGGGADIVSFELARTATRTAEIITEWGEQGRDAAQLQIWLDYGWLVLYSVALSLLCVRMSDHAADRGWSRIERVGTVLAWGALGAGACDAIENTFLLSQLSSGATDAKAGAAFAFASVKFALIIACVVYALGVWIATRVKPTPGPAPA